MKLVSALIGVAALGGVVLSSGAASAAPIEVPPGYVCNEWGHCWQRHYYGGYYHPQYWGGYGWHQHWGDGWRWHRWHRWHEWHHWHQW